MGFLWAILMPMMVVAAGALVRKAFAFASGKTHGVYIRTFRS